MKQKGIVLLILVQVLLISTCIAVCLFILQQLEQTLLKISNTGYSFKKQEQAIADLLAGTSHLKSSMLKLREALQLSTTAYTQSPQTGTKRITMAEALATFAGSYRENRLRTSYRELEANSLIHAFAMENGLQLSTDGAHRLDIGKGGNHYYSLYCTAAGIKAENNNGTEITFSGVNRELLDLLRTWTASLNFFYQKIARMRENLLELPGDDKISKLIDEKALITGKAAETKDFISLALYNGSKAVLLMQVNKIHAVYRINGINFRSIESVKTLLLDYIPRAVKNREIDALLASTIFADFLESRDLVIRRIDETDKELVLQLEDSSNQYAGKILITKRGSPIQVFDPDGDEVITTIQEGQNTPRAGNSFVIPENIPKLTSITADKTMTHILLIGAHRKLTDTIICLLGDHTAKKLTLISIPRDLYYKGRKLNAVYPWYGMKQLLNDVTAITGIRISKYIFIDMFAFVDVINILGGVDVHLAKTLYDKYSSLYIKQEKFPFLLKAGDHHLDGVNALAFVRSRKSTSDFDRARRQQQVLVSLLEKFQNLGVEDTDKILRLVRTIVDNVNTNLSPLEILNCFLRMKDYQISFKNVIDTNNVLYHTWSNLYLLKDEEIDKTKVERGQFILLPKNDDWNLIPWFIQQVLEE